TCIYITTIVERYPNYLTGEFIRYLDGSLGFISQLKSVGAFTHRFSGNGTSQLRKWLELPKDKKDKANQTPATHAVDGVTLAAFEFTQWREWHSNQAKYGNWCGDVQITPVPFAIVRRPPISRRQLHLCVPSKGDVRRKYGGTVTRHGFRKGDKVVAEKAGKVYIGWCSGDTEKQVSVSDKNWKRLGQFTAKKVQLLQRSTGLIVVPSTGLSNLATSSSKI
ncbi:MAG: hypothetical protein RID09_24570, partial [Coleofasciculus sp. G1-WW12-02]|uniref:hypothetical protein n=1 Tax=Coleofasciculus sp. G1-WW12-02 TaxID=3068483 RepID=UPI003302BAC8